MPERKGSLRYEPAADIASITGFEHTSNDARPDGNEGIDRGNANMQHLDDRLLQPPTA